MNKDEDRFDHHEEMLLRKHDAVQARLNGVWTKALDGCPHLHRCRDVNRCGVNEMRPCVYETGNGPCELFQEILEEWKEIEMEFPYKPPHPMGGNDPEPEPRKDGYLDTRVKCFKCGWQGTYKDCVYGHDDYVCPVCSAESLEEK